MQNHPLNLESIQWRQQLFSLFDAVFSHFFWLLFFLSLFNIQFQQWWILFFHSFIYGDARCEPFSRVFFPLCITPQLPSKPTLWQRNEVKSSQPIQIWLMMQCECAYVASDANSLFTSIRSSFQIFSVCIADFYSAIWYVKIPLYVISLQW